MTCWEPVDSHTLYFFPDIFCLLLSTFPGQRRRKHVTVGLLLGLNVEGVLVIQINVCSIRKKRRLSYKLKLSQDPPPRGHDARRSTHLSANSNRGLRKTSGPSVGKRSQSCQNEAWRSPGNVERGGKKDLSLDWVRICRRIFICVCWGWHVLYDLWWARTQCLINWTYITFFSFVSSALSVSSIFLFKGIIQWTICQIRHCVTNERLLARHVRVKRRERIQKK